MANRRSNEAVLLDLEQAVRVHQDSARRAGRPVPRDNVDDLRTEALSRMLIADVDALARELWGAAQLHPGESNGDGVGRIVEVLSRKTAT